MLGSGAEAPPLPGTEKDARGAAERDGVENKEGALLVPFAALSIWAWLARFFARLLCELVEPWLAVALLAIFARAPTPVLMPALVARDTPGDEPEASLAISEAAVAPTPMAPPFAAAPVSPLPDDALFSNCFKPSARFFKSSLNESEASLSIS